MLTPERDGTPGPGAGILFCQGQLSPYKERCPIWTQSLEARGRRILTSAFHMESPGSGTHFNTRISNESKSSLKSVALKEV